MRNNLINSCFVLLFLVLIVEQGISSGQNPPQNQGKINDLEGATWIGDAKIQPETDSLMYGDDPAPLFRKEFVAKEHVRSVLLYITAAGYYNATLNGEKIGKNFLDPAWTSYGKRIYYTAYDLTANIRAGQNCIGVTLGNGFYNPLPLRCGGPII